MTVCIAAICGDGKQIVTVSDTKISYESYSAEDAMRKVIRVIPGWTILCSGDDVTDVDPILDTAKASLSSGTVSSVEEVSKALHDACRKRLHEHIEASVLGHLGFSVEEFIEDGREALTESAFDSLLDKMSKVTLGVQFLLVGFDSRGKAHIRCVQADKPPASYDSVGYCAIGSGSHVATSTLAHHISQRHFSPIADIQSCIYCCCSAKFMAESADGVGGATFLSVLRWNEPTQFISMSRIDSDIRKAWETQGAPRLPIKPTEAIAGMLCSVEDLKQEGFDRFLGKFPRKLSRNRIMQEWVSLRRVFGFED